MTRIVNPQREKMKSRIAWSVAIFFAVVWVVVTVGPFVFMVLNSFRDKKMMGRQGVLHFPDPWYFQNYPDVINNGFFGFFARSLIIVSISLVLMLAISAFAAYPLARMKFKTRGLIYAGIVAMMSVPMHVTLIPVYQMTNSMGLINNLFSLLGPYVAFALPMSVFILTGFMMTIPHEMEEAAVIDGCNKYNMFFRVILPLSKAGISTLAIYNVVGMWNEFAFANTFLNDAVGTAHGDRVHHLPGQAGQGYDGRRRQGMMIP